jgi:hypothetical protein
VALSYYCTPWFPWTQASKHARFPSVGLFNWLLTAANGQWPMEMEKQACSLQVGGRRSKLRGAAKNKSTDPPPVHLLHLRPTNPPSDFFSLGFFFSTFLGVSRQGEFKNTIKMFWQKARVRVENFPQNFDQTFGVIFSSTSVVLSRFRVLFSDGSSKALQKTFCKKSCRKVFTKNSTKSQKSKTAFFSISFITFLVVSR